MNMSKIETKVHKAVEKSAPYAHDMIVRWIMNSITANTGKYIVHEIKKAKFKFTSNDKMDFSALARVAVGKDFVEETVVKIVWKLRDKKMTRKFIA